MVKRVVGSSAAVLLPVVLVLLLPGGCSRAPSRPSKAPTLKPALTQPAVRGPDSETEETTQPWHEPVDREGGIEDEDNLRRAGRKLLGHKLCEQIDKLHREWLLWRYKVVEQCRIVVIRTENEEEPFCMLVASPDDRVVQMFEAPSANFLSLTGLYDVDGDGTKDAAIRVYSGGAHCCHECYYVALGKNPRPLGGFDASNADCGTPVDLDHDGRIEFSASDDSFADFETSFADSPWIPMVYGYRNGRFMDLTAQLGKGRLRRLIAESRTEVAAGAFEPSVTAWYVAATLLGESDKALADIRRLLPAKRWARLQAAMPERQERIRARERKLWTGYPPPRE